MKPAEEIERIVLEVIRRLTAANLGAIPPEGTLQIADRVITLATIEKRLSGVRQLVVRPKAVVTPSVQDELRANNIQLVRRNQQTDTSTKRKLLAANMGSTPIENLISDLPCEVTTVSQESLEATVLSMASRLTKNALGVIFTDAPEAAACLANRRNNVNAFVGYDHESVRRATSTMEVNLLVLESSSSSIATKDMLQLFVSSHDGSAK